MRAQMLFYNGQKDINVAINLYFDILRLDISPSPRQIKHREESHFTKYCEIIQL